METAEAWKRRKHGNGGSMETAEASVFCMLNKCVLYASRYPIGPRVIISIEDFHFASRYPMRPCGPRGGFHFDSRYPTSPWGLGNGGGEMRLVVTSSGGRRKVGSSNLLVVVVVGRHGMPFQT